SVTLLSTAISTLYLSSLFFLHGSRAPRHLHSFPTRRSSDLSRAADRRRPLSRPRHPWTAAQRRPSCPRLGDHGGADRVDQGSLRDRKSTRLNSSHVSISYAVFCLKKKKEQYKQTMSIYSSRT